MAHRTELAFIFDIELKYQIFEANIGTNTTVIFFIQYNGYYQGYFIQIAKKYAYSII